MSYVNSYSSVMALNLSAIHREEHYKAPQLGKGCMSDDQENDNWGITYKQFLFSIEK